MKPETEAKDPWIELVDKVGEMRHRDVPMGIDEWITFVAEVFNGGVEQYITNGHASRGFTNALGFIMLIEGIAVKEFGMQMLHLTPRPGTEEAKDAVNTVEIVEGWDKFEDWMYKRDPSPVRDTAKEIMRYLDQKSRT